MEIVVCKNCGFAIGCCICGKHEAKSIGNV